MTEAAMKAQRAYKAAWREKNREHTRAYYRKYRKEHIENYRKYREEYWERKAAELEGVEESAEM